MKRLLALFAVASLALPVQAQFNPLAPTVPDSMYYSAEIIVAKHNLDPQHAEKAYGEQSVFLSGYLGYEWYGYNFITSPFGFFSTNISSCITNFSHRARSYSIPSFQYGGEIIQCYGITFIVQVFTKDKMDLFVGFSIGGIGGNPTQDITNATYSYLANNSYLIIGNDTLYFNKGFYPPSPDSVKGICGKESSNDQTAGRYEDPNAFKGGTRGVCWGNIDFVFTEDDIIKIELWSKQYFSKPKKPSGILRTWTDKDPGSVWLSWRIPISDPEPTEQLRLEKNKNFIMNTKCFEMEIKNGSRF